MARRRKIPDGVRHPTIVTQQEMTPDEVAVIEVMQTTRPRTRERDMALLELSDKQLSLYLETFILFPTTPEEYRQYTRRHWQYVDSHPEKYNHDGSFYCPVLDGPR